MTRTVIHAGPLANREAGPLIESPPKLLDIAQIAAASLPVEQPKTAQ
jgi:hypothetical protein